MSGELREWQPIREKVERIITNPDDLDMALAIVNQARLYGDDGRALSATQAIHLLQLGRRSLLHERDALRAAVERVRALADEWTDHRPYGDGVYGDDIRAALDGPA